MDEMKLYTGNYYDTFGYGAYQSYGCIVKAETESVALGLCLEKYPNTVVGNWTIEELDLGDHQVYQTEESGD